MKHLSITVLYVTFVTITVIDELMCQLHSNILGKDRLCQSQRVLHMSLLKERVFLSVLTGCGQGPTFLETKWITTMSTNDKYRKYMTNDGHSVSQAFPHLSRHQIFNDPCFPISCNLIQQARWSQVNDDRGHGSRLWLLDLGKRYPTLLTSNKYNCPLKLIVYNIQQHPPREEKVMFIMIMKIFYNFSVFNYI